MKLSLSSHSKVLVVALVAASMALLAGGVLQASNMGFKMNRVIQAGGVDPDGFNYVSLPFRNPYKNAQDICDALGLNPPAKVQLTHGGSGTVFGPYSCDTAAPWEFSIANDNFRIGVEIFDAPVQTSGILVGSHAGGAPGVNIYAGTAATAPFGVNDFPVLYHGTAADAQDVCTQLGLDPGPPPAAAAHLEARDGLGGISTHDCGLAFPFALVLGQYVRITNQTSGNIIGVVVPHF